MKDRPPLPWRVFGVIGLLIVVTAYSALNLENRSDVSLGLYTFRGVPVFLTSLVALIMGAVLVVPLTFRKGGRRHRRDIAVVGDDSGGDAGDDAPVAAGPFPTESDSAQPEVLPEPDSPDEDQEEPKEATRRRRRWPFGVRKRVHDPRDQDPDATDTRDRDASGGG